MRWTRRGDVLIRAMGGGRREVPAVVDADTEDYPASIRLNPDKAENGERSVVFSRITVQTLPPASYERYAPGRAFEDDLLPDVTDAKTRLSVRPCPRGDH